MLEASLKRLYEKGQVSISQLESMRDTGKITEDEYTAITGNTDHNEI